jgi:hypothetical protein
MWQKTPVCPMLQNDENVPVEALECSDAAQARLVRYFRILVDGTRLERQGARTMKTATPRSHAAVMYARVSSKDQEREGFSIPAQQSCCVSTPGSTA